MHIAGKNRLQIEMSCLEDRITAVNPVRVIDAFIDALDLEKLGFGSSIPEYSTDESPNPSAPLVNKGGRPSYASCDLLRLYIYGYYNRIRSSRMLERECWRNVELHWLIGGISPNYHTISDFRKDHRKALKKVFKIFVRFLLENELIEGDTLAIDGTKVRAVNSKKNNYNKAKVERQLSYIENKTEEYLNQLEEMDASEKAGADLQIKKEEVQAKIEKLKINKVFYNNMARRVAQSEDLQVSTTDPDSRSMPIHHNQIEVAYNIQCATDQKNCLITHFEVTNENDTKALFKAAHDTKEALQKSANDSITVLADKGYHNGEQLHQCEAENIITIVANRERSAETNNIPTADYFSEKFIYDAGKNTYTCPAGETLTTNGSWYTKDHTAKTRKKSTKYLFQQFKTKACTSCGVKQFCTKNAKGRIIDRSEHQDTVDRNNARMINEKSRYLLRQQIVEHPFGTIKRSWGYYFTLLKGKEKVNGEYAIIFTVYNLRRSVSILGVPELIKRLKAFKEMLFNFFYTHTTYTAFRNQILKIIFFSNRTITGML